MFNVYICVSFYDNPILTWETRLYIF